MLNDIPPCATEPKPVPAKHDTAHLHTQPDHRPTILPKHFFTQHQRPRFMKRGVIVAYGKDENWSVGEAAD
jgi:hypothetical protein